MVTVHDLTPVRFPELCTADTLAYPGLIRRALRGGAWIHTPSQFVADEVVEAFDADPERVVAIPNGVTEIGPDSPGRDAAEGERLAGSGRYLLAIGTIEPRKDLPWLVDAFDVVAASHPDVSLVVAGPDGWGVDDFDRAVARATHRARVVRLGWVDPDQRAALLARRRGPGLPVALRGLRAAAPRGDGGRRARGGHRRRGAARGAG